eukprot:COSAG02_NODE_83_length_39665_cov_25.213719_13_plen_59_part_00
MYAADMRSRAALLPAAGAAVACRVLPPPRNARGGRARAARAPSTSPSESPQQRFKLCY